MSFGWLVSQRFLNGLMLAVDVMLTACVPIDETFDHRYAALQSGYSPFIAATQNQPSTLDGSRIAPDQTDLINLAASQSSTAITQPDKPHKNDLLTAMEISLGTDHTISIWQFYPPATTAEQMHAQTTRHDIIMQVNNRLFATYKRVTILTPADPFFWPQIGSLIQPVVIQLHYFCSIDCTSIPSSGDGLLQVDFDTNQAQIRNMALTSRNKSQLIGQLNFNFERLSKNSFLDPNAQLIFSIDSAQQHIFNAKVLGAIDPAPAPFSNGAFGAANTKSDNALTGHVKSK